MQSTTNEPYPKTTPTDIEQAAIYVAQAALLVERRRRRGVFRSRRLVHIVDSLNALVPVLDSLARCLDGAR